MRVLMLGMCIAICLLGNLPALATPVISVQPHDVVVGLGDYFTVDIIITDVQDLYNVNLNVLFDSAIMDYHSYTAGDFLATEGDPTSSPFSPNIDQTAGTLEQYVESIQGAIDGVSGSGVLLSITFQATNMGTGLIDIGAELSDSFLFPIVYDREPGTVSVIPEPASMAMLGALGAGLLLMHRRRRNK